MLAKFTTFIRDKELARQNDKILMAVSGGIDSMVMASLFLRAGYLTGIAHCNFSLRGKESDLDEELVKDFAGKHNAVFHSERFNTKEYAASKGISIQMAARELRYSWFEKIRSENGYSSVAVAHNFNDNTETLLLNLVRGTGITGLTGIKPRSNNIIRPLLFAKRSEIEEYSAAHGIVFREDRSNSDTKYLRNKIRHKVLPLLRELNPSVEDTLGETILRLTGINELVSDITARLRKELSEENGYSVLFDVNKLSPYCSNSSLIYELFRPYGSSGVPVDDLINIINGRTGSMVTTASHTILKDRELLIVRPLTEPDDAALIFNGIDELAGSGLFSEVVLLDADPHFIIPPAREVHCLDAGSLRFPLEVRHWRKGDSFYPLGMNNMKKLSDYFTDRKFSLFDKESALLLISGGTVAAILGERTDNRFRIGSSTSKILKLTFSRTKS
jgi:tRNA(Ile)-lysidine synthase